MVSFRCKLRRIGMQWNLLFLCHSPISGFGGDATPQDGNWPPQWLQRGRMMPPGHVRGPAPHRISLHHRETGEAWADRTLCKDYSNVHFSQCKLSREVWIMSVKTADISQHSGRWWPVWQPITLSLCLLPRLSFFPHFYCPGLAPSIRCHQLKINLLTPVLLCRGCRLRHLLIISLEAIKR